MAVNGVEVFETGDFSRQVDVLEAPISLFMENSISVELNSQPGSYLTVEVFQQAKSPSVTLTANPESISAGGTATLSWNSTNAQNAFIDNGIGVVPPAGTITVSPDHSTTYTITATGSTGSASAQATLMVMGNPEPLPAGSFGAGYNDLLPPDSTVLSYEPERFSLITGLVHNLDDMPIAGVSVTIHGHPEYGTAYTDAAGRFTIPVEGGGPLTLQYRNEGLITAHRQVNVPWNDIAIAETIKMISEDPISTTFTFDGNPGTVITHQSTWVSDEFGSRSATLVFTGDNMAYALDENGNTVTQLATIIARATEFTTEDSMPAVLPPNSAYTYCVELTIDGVQRVRFAKPVIIWVNNFLGFDVGEVVPVGYYDRYGKVSDCSGRNAPAWIPSDNGVVVRLLDTDNNGIVDALDTNEDDQPDDLDGDGVFIDEVIGLNDQTMYTPGSTFWRVAVSHFTPFDLNWPHGPPQDAVSSNTTEALIIDQAKEEEPATTYEADFEEITCVNSYIKNRSRVFHEDIFIPGTDLTLHYASDRVNDYKTAITVPASGDTVPASLKGITVKMSIAGRDFEQNLEPLPNQTAEFVWDGLDYLGRQIYGPVTASVNIGFEYDAVYYQAGDYEQAFAKFGCSNYTCPMTTVRSRQEVVIWKNNDIKVMGRKAIDFGNGWAINYHHYLSPDTPNTLFKGDGSRIENQAPVIDTVAGTGIGGFSGDGGAATEAQLFHPIAISADAEGNLYINDLYNDRIRMVDTNGNISTIVGSGVGGYGGDCGPAVEALINGPFSIAADASGNLYFTDTVNDVIRKVNKEGTITTIVGNGTRGYSGDDGPAVQAKLNNPQGVAVDSNGNVYIADLGNHRIRKVDSNGIITTVAGNGIPGYSGDGGPAVEARISFPFDVNVDNQGQIFITDAVNSRIRRIDAQGIITTVAGNGIWGFSGDGGLATEASLSYPNAVSLDAKGNIYIADYNNNRIRKVDSNGIITTVAGTGIGGFSGDGGSATKADIYHPVGIAFAADDNLYFSSGDNNRVRKIDFSSSLDRLTTQGELAFAEENGLGHIFYESGLHKNTVDLDTGVVLREFGYDQYNNLTSITDQFGNQTIIERDGDGTPIAIVSPDGLRTQLSINASNHLTGITYPDGSSYGFVYTTGGLMTAELEPNGNRFGHYFDANGRLTDVYDEEGGHWNYNRTVFENGDVQVNSLTAEGNLTTYLDHAYSTGAFSSTIIDPTGAWTVYSQSDDGLSADKTLPCGMTLAYEYGLDSEYRYKFVKETTETTPQGLTRITLRDRAYQDTSADEVPDIITETGTINGKTTYLVNNVSQSQRTFTSPEGRTITAYYDPASLLTTGVSTPGLFETSYGYDPEGRLTSVNTNTRSTSFVYNANGFLDHITDPKNYTSYYGYDAVGRVTSMSRPDNSAIGFTYDLNGNMTVLTNPLTIDHGFGYNAVNRNTIYQTPLSGSYSYVYDRDRRLIRTNFPSGRQINNIYDTTQLAQVQTPEGNINYSYLCSSKVDTIAKGTETITYGYDGSLLTSEAIDGTLNKSLIYDYNDDFNLSGFAYAGSATGYAYDNDGLLTGAGAFAITRNVDNGLPVSVSDNALSLDRAFNGYAEVAGEDFKVNGRFSSSWSVTRDNTGRIITKTEIVAGVTSTYAYSYDPLGRLLTVTRNGSLVEEYSYDLNGGRTSEINGRRNIAGRSFYYSDEDHLLAVGDTSYQYDLDGFLTTRIQGTEVTTYSYSSRGELLSVNLPDERLVEYVHDPLGRRIAKKINGVIVEKYLWAGLTQLLAIYDSSDNLLMRFEYADSRMPMAMTSGGAVYYLAYDQVGSLRVVADSVGNIVKSIEYDSFGNFIADSNPLFEMPFGFAGGLQDKDTGLVRFGARDFDPDIGRWTAKDPILFAGGDTDLYGYCLSDPVNLIDPFGLADWGKTVTGALSVTDGLTMMGVSYAGTVATFMGTGGNPVLTGIVGAMLLPMAATGAYDLTHGVHLLWEGLTEDDKCHN